MLIDSRLEFSNAQALTASAASTNVVDLGQDRDIGPGRPLWVVITVDVAADSTTGDETYAIALETDDNAGFSSATTLLSRTIAAADLFLGSQHVIPVTLTNERYLRLAYSLGGTTPSLTVNAWLTDQEPQIWRALPDAT